MSEDEKEHCRKAFSEEEARNIQEKLSMKLGPEYLSYRPGVGGMRHAYVEGWVMLNLMNSIFGFNGWSSKIVSLSSDYFDEINGRFFVGISCTVRVVLKDGTFHEDVGYGTAENQKSKGSAYEKARKEAVTDATKRALRFFGNCMGNCTYDKNFVNDLRSVKVPKRETVDETCLMTKAREKIPRTESLGSPLKETYVENVSKSSVNIQTTTYSKTVQKEAESVQSHELNDMDFLLIEALEEETNENASDRKVVPNIETPFKPYFINQRARK